LVSDQNATSLPNKINQSHTAPEKSFQPLAKLHDKRSRYVTLYLASSLAEAAGTFSFSLCIKFANG
jgi:hypothetical protein